MIDILFHFKEMIISSILVFIIAKVITRNIYKHYKRTKSHQLLLYVPNIWTSLGILGTFVSIVLSLQQTTDYNDITNLIANISPAFATSVVGILGSIWYSLKIKKQFAVEECDEIKAYNKESKVSPEIVLANLLDSSKKIEERLKLINDTSKQNKKELQKGLTDIKGAVSQVSIQMGNAIGEDGAVVKNQNSIIVNVNNVLKKIESQNSTIQQFLKELTNNISKYYEGVLNKTNQASKELFERHIIDYKNILEKYNHLIEETSSKSVEDYKLLFKEIHDSITTSVRNEFDRSHSVYAEECTKISSECLNKFDQALQRMESSLSQMQNKTDDVDSVLIKHSTAVHEQIKTESEKLNQISQELQKLSTELVNKLTSLSDQTRGALSRIQEDTKTEVITKMKETTNSMIEEVSQLKQSLASSEEIHTVELYENFKNQLSQSVYGLSESLNKDSDALNKLLSEFEKTGNGRKEILAAIASIMQFIATEKESISISLQSAKDMQIQFAEVSREFTKTSDDIHNLIYQIKSMTNRNIVEVKDGKKTCPKCGTENIEQANFCSSCNEAI